MKLRPSLLLAFTIFFADLSFGQSGAPTPPVEIAQARFMEKQVISPAPEAAELGKYGNVPISLFTGTPTISIPIFELKGTNISLPISLSYNATGFKPEEQATWVGSNWSLNAGGVITRSVMGNPDVKSNYFDVANILNPPNHLDLFPFYEYIKDINNGTKEAQPDVYFYNFAGHSGKFVLRPDYSVMKKQDDFTVISLTKDYSTGEIGSFTVTDDQGFTYLFNAVETTHMQPNDGNNQPESPYTYNSSWYLTKITAPNYSDIMNFEYYSTGYQPANMYPKDNESYSSSDQVGMVCDNNLYFVGPQGGHSFNTPPEITTTRQYLKKITASSGYVDLISADNIRQDGFSPSDRQLQQIKIYNNSVSADLIKQFDFTQSYFENTNNPFYKRKLKLDAVQERGTDGVTVVNPPYQFSYNNDLNLPDRYTFNVDHWGFFNNAYNTSLTPSISFYGGQFIGQTTCGGHANREPNLAGTLFTVLNKIQYPTGGYTTFDYELNKAGTMTVGGLRVRKMTDNSFPDKPAVIKNYTYILDDGTSSGVARTPEYATTGVYHHYLEPYFVSMTPCSEAVYKQDYTLNTISVAANSIFGLGSIQGSHIGYSQVTESQTDWATGQPLGKTVYKYYAFMYASGNDDDINNGNLLNKLVYDNSGKLLRSDSSIYGPTGVTDNISTFTPRANTLQDNKEMFCQSISIPGDYINYQGYQTPSPDCGQIRTYYTKFNLLQQSITKQGKRLISQITKVYDQLSNNYITSTKNLLYGNPAHSYPTKITEVSNNNEQVVTLLKYAEDFPGSPAAGAASLISANIHGRPIEKLQLRQDAFGNNKRYINGQITNYDISSFNPKDIFVLESSAPLTTVVQAAAATPPFSPGSIGLTYDSHYRLAGSFAYDYSNNVTDQGKANDVPKGYLWAYGNLYPVAEVQGATSSQIAYSSFENNSGSFGNFHYHGISLSTLPAVTGSSYLDLSTSTPITYTTADPAKVYTLSYWSQNNTPYTVTGTTSYKKGGTHNGWTYYEHVVTGVTTMSLTGSGLIDELRFYPAGALMGTYTYDPLKGKTSECNANNIVTCYDYDVANRLVNIRDQDRNIVKNYTYHYAPNATAITGSVQTLFYNAEQQGTFYRTDCTGGRLPDAVIYKVSYGRYSATSQLAADALATTDKTTNGPIYAQANGHCWFWNDYYRRKAFKNDCPPSQGFGSPMWYEVAANTYHSDISKDDANAMAVADADANAQNYVNLHGTCSCGAEGQAMINGTCETGVRYYTQSTYVSPGHYTCIYHYRFSDGSHSINYTGSFTSSCSILYEP